jgi:hypothetical protein
MLCLWRNENSQDKDGDAGNVLHFRSSQTQDCGFAVARSEQKKLKRSNSAGSCRGTACCARDWIGRGGFKTRPFAVLGDPRPLPSSDPNFPFLKLSNQIPSEGEDIVVVGNPLGLESTVSTGIVSAVRIHIVYRASPLSTLKTATICTKNAHIIRP